MSCDWCLCVWPLQPAATVIPYCDGARVMGTTPATDGMPSIKQSTVHQKIVENVESIQFMEHEPLHSAKESLS